MGVLLSVQHSSTRIAPSRTVRPRAAVPTGTDGSTELRAPLVSNLTSRLWPVQVSNASTVLPSNAAAGPRTQPCEGVSAVTLLPPGGRTVRLTVDVVQVSNVPSSRT